MTPNRSEHRLFDANDASTELARSMIDNLFAFVGLLTTDGTLLEANAAPLTAAGITLDEVRGRKFWDCYWWSYSRPVQEELRAACEAAAGGRLIRYETVVRMLGDSRMTIDFQVAPLRDVDGRITHLVPSAVDITERRQAELNAREAARVAEAERAVLDAILEAAPVGIVLADREGTLVRENKANELLWGREPPADPLAQSTQWRGWWADHSERHGERVRSSEWALARALRGETVRGQLVEIEPFDAPGTRKTMLNAGAPVRAADGTITGAVVAQMDISALTSAQRALAASEAQLRALADNIPQLAWMTDETGSIHWYNKRWFEYTGTTLAAMAGWGWRAVHHPDHVERVEHKFRQHLERVQPWEDTFPLRSKEGWYRWFLSRAFPLRDTEGRVLGWFGTNTDITEQREAQEALRAADRRKDEFIGTLAHELRNPLGPVRNAVAILDRVPDLDPKIARARDIIGRQVTHMVGLVDDLLDVARIARGKLQLSLIDCDLAAIARQTAEDYRGSLEAAGCQLVTTIPSQPLMVRGDPVRLGQMVGNYLQNAQRFGAAGIVNLDAYSDPAAGMAVVAVADRGVGISAQLLPELFQSFRQADQGLARSQGGLGLGLALTKGLAQLHGGGVDARSEGPGKGATFELRIPLSSPVSHQAQPPATRMPEEPEGQHVLVIEDHKDSAETLQVLLEAEGYRVLVAHEPMAGLGMAEMWRPDIIICDIGLPQMDGYQVAETLRSKPLFANTLLIALSGYADADARRRSSAAGFDIHFAKPVEPQELIRCMGSIRDSSRAVA